MPRSAAPLSKQKVEEWFKGLPFEEQDKLIQQFTAFSQGNREKMISELEERLARLRGSTVKPAVPTKSTPAKAHPNKGMKIEPKYRDPKTGQTWAGRGVQPKWLQEAVAKGAKVEKFLIAKK